MQGLGLPHPITRYTGRFAPSPTGPLHAGSLATALASWLDARAWSNGAKRGRWLIRIEDIDAQRCNASTAQYILSQLAACHLIADAPPIWQSQRTGLYEKAFAQLQAQKVIYPCACSRQDIQRQLQIQGHVLQPHQESVYPGTCRAGLIGRPAKSWRFNAHQLDVMQARSHQKYSTLSPVKYNAMPSSRCIQGSSVQWVDRRLGIQSQNVSQIVGDFVIRRTDQQWAYQLAVVVDDADQSVTHVVRGEDLASNTARQILLQNCLGFDTPSYLHTPIIVDNRGQKLSKQTNAPPIDVSNPYKALCDAAEFLKLPRLDETKQPSIAHALNFWINAWDQAVDKL